MCSPKTHIKCDIVTPSSDHFHTDAVVPSSDHCRTETVLPPSDHYLIETVAPSGDHYDTETVPPSSDHHGTMKVAPPSDHLHTKRTLQRKLIGEKTFTKSVGHPTVNCLIIYKCIVSRCYLYSWSREGMLGVIASPN